MSLILAALQVLMIVIVVDAVLSWIVPPNRFPRSFTTRLTDPIYAPIRRVLDPGKTGGLDLAPLIVLLLIQLARSALVQGTI